MIDARHSPSDTLSDANRKLLHDFALWARALLTQEARDVLQGAFGLGGDGRPARLDALPATAADPDAAEAHRRLVAHLDDEARAGLPRPAAVERLVKEIAFTHLNRLAAFKMMEARGLIHEAVGRGPQSNGFKRWLVDHPDELAAYERGRADDAYRRFLLWQAAQAARELAVLFDPEELPGLIFPRPRALAELLARLNDPALAPAWQQEESIGWLYQFFNEQEKAQVFDRLYKQKQKLRREDIPAATQLFTPNWIVRFLVQNTLGRLWLEMHPDSRLALDYLVVSGQWSVVSGQSDAPATDHWPPAIIRSVTSITLLDPACGSMHFGLAAFDLFAAMYAEEMARAGEPGWPAAPPLADAALIPAAILERNLFGIDIDLRATQLAALALWLRAKRANPRAVVRGVNLAPADVSPLNGERLEAFLGEMQFSPLTARLIGELWAALRDAADAGSLLRLERALAQAIDRAQREFAAAPLLAYSAAGFSPGGGEASEFWDTLESQVEQGLDEFARAHGHEARYFTGEAHKGIRLLDVARRRYDVVVANPPYSGKRNLNERLAKFLEKQYPTGKGDLYAAFIQRCAELAADDGRVGLITQQSFMFLSSFEGLRAGLRQRFAVETMAHLGPRAFPEISGEKVNTTAFVLRAEPDTAARDAAEGVYFRLVHPPTGEEKQRAFEAALRDGRDVYRLPQGKFDAIPGSPWVYWVNERVRRLFAELPALGDVARPRQGLATADNFRFLRFWWEVGREAIGFGCSDAAEALATGKTWFPIMKGGARRWYGNQEYVVNWARDGHEIKEWVARRYPYLNGKWEWVVKNTEYYFREGITFSTVSSGFFTARFSPVGYIFDVTGSSLFPEETTTVLSVLNSPFVSYTVGLINPTIHYQVGDVARLPIAEHGSLQTDELARKLIWLSKWQDTGDETTYDFIAPLDWRHGPTDDAERQARLAALEAQINDEVYRLYDISPADRAAIEAELGIRNEELGIEEGENDDDSELVTRSSSLVTRNSSLPTPQDLAVRWISYAIGVVLGRFSPGTPGALGRAIYRPEDFAAGSLPAPSAAEFDALVGPPSRFAYNKEEARHLFPAETEAALRALALPDGIATLDPGHPRDLPALVERALALMLGDAAAGAILSAGAGGDLRRFLGRDYFTKHHFSWYRQRPVYWPLQSAGRAYGFVVFHERAAAGRDFLYVLLADYLEARLRGLGDRAAEARTRAEGLAGPARRAAERDAAEQSAALAEVEAFGRAIRQLADDGYRPAPDWLDDGVMLRLAPLHELLPLWRAEPKKHWERLRRGDFDWSHIARHYRPDLTGGRR